MIPAESKEFKERLIQEFSFLTAPQVEKLGKYRDLVVDEQKRQNLTKLLSIEDFLWGHIADCVETAKNIQLEYPVLDLGSGCGVPGIPLAILIENSGPWILSESEKMKADFLERAVRELKIEDRVSVSAERAEKYLKTHQVKTIITRAVGTVSKVFSLLSQCSTWNKLLLYKGPGWDKEWSDFQEIHKNRGLGVDLVHLYAVRDKSRKLVSLARQNVPRGT